MNDPVVRKAVAPGRWADVALYEYKAEGEAPFRDVTRQVLFDLPELDSQWRYFEVAAGGHSTLERHVHVHAVLVLLGRGQCLVGDQVSDIHTHDLVTVPPLTWHQFRANGGEKLGFLCLVNRLRDKPQLPAEEDLIKLMENPRIAAFLDQ
jgi:mannose-6-phosphate isomerase-like protein (cupin superfamily)